MAIKSIAKQEERFGLGTRAPRFITGGALFYLKSTRRTKTGVSTTWTPNQDAARSWKTKAAVDSFASSNQHLKARVVRLTSAVKAIHRIDPATP